MGLFFMTSIHTPILHELFSTKLKTLFGQENQALSTIRVLDLGCGRGSQIIYMKGLGFQMSGCDIRQKDIECALSALKGSNGPAADVRLSTPSELPFETGEFHAVYANGVFEHCPEMPALIAEVSRVLIPGGIFLTAFPLRSVVVEPHLGLPFVHWFGEGKLQRLLIRLLTPLFRPARSCQSIEKYLQNEVFYWNSAQVRQTLSRHFEETNSLAKEYLMVAKSQTNRNPVLQFVLTATGVPIVSSILEHVVSRYWTYVVEAINPIKR